MKTIREILQEIDERGLQVIAMRWGGQGTDKWGVRIGLAEWREAATLDAALIAAWDRYDAETGGAA